MTKCPDQFSLRVWLRDLEKAAFAEGFSSDCWGWSGGLPLLGFRRKSAKNGPRVYLSAGIHGDEPAGPKTIEKLIETGRLSKAVSWTICPLLNPCGLIQGTREGLCGRDHNRDYLHPKTGETAAHSAWIDRCGGHELYLSLHEDWEADGFYLYEINTSGKAGFAKEILEQVGRVMRIESSPLIDDHEVAAPGYIAHEPEPDEPDGWPEAIYHSKLYPRLSYTFETPSSFALERRIEALALAVESAVEEKLKIFFGRK